METTGQQILPAARSERLWIDVILTGNKNLFPFTHLGPKSRCGATRFSLNFGRGGIGIFGCRKSGSKCGEISPVDIKQAFSKGGIQYPQLLGTGSKSDCGPTAFRLKMSTPDCKFCPPSIKM